MALVKIGAAWLRKPKKGGYAYLSLLLEYDVPQGTNLLLHRNTFKEKPNQPDYNLNVDTEAYPMFADPLETGPEPLVAATVAGEEDEDDGKDPFEDEPEATTPIPNATVPRGEVEKRRPRQ